MTSGNGRVGGGLLGDEDGNGAVRVDDVYGCRPMYSEDNSSTARADAAERNLSVPAPQTRQPEPGLDASGYGHNESLYIIVAVLSMLIVAAVAGLTAIFLKL